MGLLATWSRFSTYVDWEGKYRVIWQWPDDTIEFHKFDEFMDEPALELEFADILLEREYGWIERLQAFLDEEEALILTIVQYIRSHPTATLSQWDTLLKSKEWYESATARSFVFRLAVKLAEHYEVELSDYTEGEVFLKTRNWICNTNVNVLKKVIFGYFIEL